MRFITASESYWCISGNDVYGREPSIQRLAIHEENLQTVYFQENNVAEAITNPKNTTLLAWFKLNQVDADAWMLKYHEIPEHYVWNQSQHQWTKRKRGRCIGRLYTTNPSQGERHYLHILIHHIPGTKSFEDLKMSLDGMLLSTFKETAIAHGLLEHDTEWDNCLSEASISFMPKQFRSLFVTILIFGQPAKPFTLWEKYKDVMAEDISQNFPLAHTMCNADKQKGVMNKVLLCLQEELEGMGSSLEVFGLPSPNLEFHVQTVPKTISKEMFYAQNQADIGRSKCEQLNTDQAHALSAIMEVVNDDTHVNRLFFLNAPGGYGKTFLIEALLSTVRGLGKIALAVASSGIAAELLEGARTAHSRFKIPIPINESSVCNISLQSDIAKLIQKTSLIIWDEIMSHVHQVDCVDCSLWDIMKIDKPFGGIAVIFGGDPHQILPVVHHGNQCKIVQACINSCLWDKIQQLKLTINMRLKPDEVGFANYLLQLGNGTTPVHPEIGEDMVKVPNEYLVHSTDELIDKVFPQLENGYVDKYFISHQAILTPLNDNVDKLNEVIMAVSWRRYLSADSVADEDMANTYPTDFLNSVTLSGMPPHVMTLKVGAPVMLLHNLRAGPGYGLLNGTRMIVLTLGQRVVEVEISSGVNRGNRILIPHITIAPSDTELPFTLKHHQFPLQPCFAMSTNKAQGQTLQFVGIYLPDHVFTHGQLYVAFSRVTDPSALAVCLNNPDGFTRNIVFQEVL